MTVSSSTRKAGPFNCNGVLTSFPFTFKCFSSDDVRVVFTSTSAVETDLVLDTDYTLSLNADQNSSPGGTVETLTAYATGEKITIVSDVDFLQETDIQNQGGFYPEVIENALDKVTMLVQQVKEEVDRSVKVNVSSDLVPEDYLTQAALSATNAAASASAASASASSASASASAAAVSAGEIVGFEWAGSWVTATAYVKNNLVSESGNTYIALSDHTSGTFFTDFGNGLWAIFALKGAAGAGTGDMLAANNLSEVNPDAARANISAAKSGAVVDSQITQSTNRILGRTTAGTGAIEEISIGDGLTLSAGVLSRSSASTGTLIGYQVFTSSGTYTKGTNNPSFVIVEVVGGGGGITGAGGTSSFGAFLSATGGAAAVINTSGANGGVGSGGDINLPGQKGSVNSCISYQPGTGSPPTAYVVAAGGVSNITGAGTGASSASSSSSGSSLANVASGAGAGYSRKKINSSSLASSETVTVGAAGAGAGISSATAGIVIVWEYK